MADVNAIERTAPGTVGCFSLLALVLLGTRFVQGFIFWGGASRRLIYNFHEVNGAEVAAKLDFDSAGFVANKLTHALPHAVDPGTARVVAAISGSDHRLGLDLDAGRARRRARSDPRAFSPVWRRL